MADETQVKRLHVSGRLRGDDGKSIHIWNGSIEAETTQLDCKYEDISDIDSVKVNDTIIASNGGVALVTRIEQPTRTNPNYILAIDYQFSMPFGEQLVTNLQNNINAETEARIASDISLQENVNVINNKAGICATITTSDFVVTSVSQIQNNYIEVDLLCVKNGTVFETRHATLFYWGSAANNATISDGISFTIPVVIQGTTITIHFSQITILDASYAYAGVGKVHIRSI